jgi:tetratricopeptide (TPR) repeat protein
MKTIVCMILVLFASGAFACAQPADPAQVLADAERTFQEAVVLADESPQKAEQAFALAAAHYQVLVDEYGVESASLYLNLGNARLLSGDVGRAVLNYRRALRLAPADPDIKAALDLARGSVGVAVQPDLPARSISLLGRTLTVIGRPLVFIVAIGCWIAAWVVCAIRRSRAHPLRFVPVPALFVVGLVGTGTLVLEQALSTQIRTGVVVWDEVQGRSGPGVGVYDETFDRPLPSGLELTIVGERDGWLEAQLADGRITWLPSDAIEEL